MLAYSHSRYRSCLFLIGSQSATGRQRLLFGNNDRFFDWNVEDVR